MFNDVFGDLKAISYALLASGYLCEFIHSSITHWPRCRNSLRALLIWARTLTIRSILKVTSAAAIGAGYILMFIYLVGCH